MTAAITLAASRFVTIVIERGTVITTTAHRYITTDPQILSGEPIIVGTRTPVRAIVELWRQGIAPETIPSRLPHLTLAQVFDALSYFSDHQDEIQQHVERNRVPDALIDPLVCNP